MRLLRSSQGQIITIKTVAIKHIVGMDFNPSKMISKEEICVIRKIGSQKTFKI